MQSIGFFHTFFSSENWDQNKVVLKSKQTNCQNMTLSYFVKLWICLHNQIEWLLWMLQSFYLRNHLTFISEKDLRIGIKKLKFNKTVFYKVLSIITLSSKFCLLYHINFWKEKEIHYFIDWRFFDCQKVDFVLIENWFSIFNLVPSNGCTFPNFRGKL